MRRQRLIAASLLVAIGCGEETGSDDLPAGLAQLCDRAAPTLLLPLADDEMVAWDPQSIVDIGERTLIGITDHVGISTFYTTGHRLTAASRIVSVSQCGGDQRTVAEGVDGTYAAPSPDAPSFGCAGGLERMTWIDPAGLAAPRPVDAIGCMFAWVDERVVFERPLGPDGRQLVAARFDAVGGAFDVDVLATDAAHWERRSVGADPTTPGDEPSGHVFALVGSDVVDINVRTGEETVVAQDAVRFGAQYPYLVYFTATNSFFLDLERDLLIELESTSRSFHDGPVFGPDTVAVYDNGGWGATGMLTLEDHQFSSRNEHWTPVAAMSDGTRVLEGGTSNSPSGLYSWEPGRAEEYLEGRTVETLQDGDLWVLTHSDGRHERGQQVTRIDDPTLQPHLVVDDVYRPQRLDDGSWISVRAEIGDVSGPLLVVHEQSENTELVDEDVHLEFSVFRGASLRPRADRVVTYVVEHGTRRGLWTARLAARPI